MPRTTTKKKSAPKKTTKKATKKKATKKPAAKPGGGWTYTKVMAELKKCGTAQNRKVFARHGADPDRMFGVSFADLGRLQKSIKVDHELAMRLWDTDNSDAMTLGAMVMDPAQLKRGELDKMVRGLPFFMVSLYLARAVAKSAHGLACCKKWCAMKGEMVRRCGYDVLGSMVKDGAEIPKAELKRYLKTIEQEVLDSPNRAKESMNSALICIGVYRDDLFKEAMRVAEKVGNVGVDHGDTSCKDFIATVEIEKGRAHRLKKAAKRK